ncbi:hypothetical protein CKO28_03150 [Rhodovibrio sodomensis]|uniref:Uncharacterized protein n=1 Tax=Rhodovibrio sodomensis TaxID=1088 RepID=A0ABS1DAV3_9PROT|nr:hypothetical protein [Rhodovibrio sodomensis]
MLAAYLHNPLADQDIEGLDRKMACEIIRTLRRLPPEHARPPFRCHHAVRTTLPFAAEVAIADAAALAGRPGQYASAVMAFAHLIIDDQMDILSDRQPVYFVFDGTGDPALIAKIEAEIAEQKKAAVARRRAEAARQAEEARE